MHINARTFVLQRVMLQEQSAGNTNLCKNDMLRQDMQYAHAGIPLLTPAILATQQQDTQVSAAPNQLRQSPFHTILPQYTQTRYIESMHTLNQASANPLSLLTSLPCGREH